MVGVIDLVTGSGAIEVGSDHCSPVFEDFGFPFDYQLDILIVHYLYSPIFNEILIQ